MESRSGILYIVSTPIGNLDDITYRAVKILSSVNIIAAEDTRRSRVLLNHYDINPPKMVSYFEHNKLSRIPKIINELKLGKNVALISDAGTPGISDPAYKLTREAIANQIRIESIPGPSAILASLVSSGLPTDRFLFEGFLPPKKGRKKRLENLKKETATIVFYESPMKLLKTLNDIFNIFEDSPMVIARELTKMHEEIYRGVVSDCISYFSKKKPKGEFVILLGKKDPNVYFK